MSKVDKALLTKVVRSNTGHPNLVKISSKSSRHKYCFSVLHYAGEVSYDIRGLLVRNRVTYDTHTQNEIKQLLSSSSVHKGIAQVFQSCAPLADALSSNRREGHTRRASLSQNCVTRIGEVKRSFGHVLQNLDNAHKHFIKCIKSARGTIPPSPSPSTAPSPRFETRYVLQQLKQEGLFDLCRLRHVSLSVRLAHPDFFDRYKGVYYAQERELAIPGDVARVARALVQGDRYRVGKTTVFLSHEAFGGLETARALLETEKASRIQQHLRRFVQERAFRRYKAAIGVLQRRENQYSREAESTEDPSRRKQATVAYYVAYRECVENLPKGTRHVRMSHLRVCGWVIWLFVDESVVA